MTKIKKNTKSITKKNTKRKVKPSMIIKLFIIGVSIFSTYILFLDKRIHEEFEGRKWTLPARVYSRVIDIYIGQKFSIANLEQRLLANNYQQRLSLAGPGTYTKSDNRINVYLRKFDYWDGHTEANPYQIEFENSSISHILDLKTNLDTSLLRIEPKLIGKIYPDHNEDRILVTHEDVPPFLVNALVTVEDRAFYSHHGIDFKAIFRAFLVNIKNRELSQGGSTLTQQLVKNYFLSQERTLSRKVNEVIMALLLERRYDKADILSAYINEVYLGQDGARGIHGFGSAAEFYFNKPLSELRDDQQALLVTLVRGASYYNPRRSPDRTKSRRDLILKLMQEQGYLDQKTLSSLQNSKLDITDAVDKSVNEFQIFLDLARRQLLRDYNIEDLKNEGLKIYTTVDAIKQQNLNAIVSKQLLIIERHPNLSRDTLESATIVVNPTNGEVLAVNGGRNAVVSGFNRALDARRPIGSLIKPFIYLTALSETDNYSLLSILTDSHINLKQEDGSLWEPDNYDKTEHGKVGLIEAMIHSYNLATVQLGLDVGLDKIISTLQHAGVEGNIQAYPSLLLGALELSPFQVAQLYQSLANGGYMVPLNSIQEVLDDEGMPLQQRPLKMDYTQNEQAVYLVNFLLTKVVELGTARQLSDYLGQNIQLAGKTGTTNESRDSWFAGFSDDILAITWVGRDDNQSTPLTGSSGAMKIWAAMMNQSGYRPLNLIEPANIAWTDDISILVDGKCINMGKIPYIGSKEPENGMTCSTLDDGVNSIFNIRGWFQ
jgi:penicillin-binding protein 1B